MAFQVERPKGPTHARFHAQTCGCDAFKSVGNGSALQRCPLFHSGLNRNGLILVVLVQALTVSPPPPLHHSGAPPPDGPVPACGPGGAGPGAHPSHRRAAAATDPEELPPVPVTTPTDVPPSGTSVLAASPSHVWRDVDDTRLLFTTLWRIFNPGFQLFPAFCRRLSWTFCAT